MMDVQLVIGQPARKASKTSEDKKLAYRMGYQAANIKSQREQLRQEADFTLLQKAMLGEMVNRFKDVLAEINRKQKGIDVAVANMMGPPPLEAGGAPFNAPPELPLPPSTGGGMGPGMPPPMGGPAFAPPEEPSYIPAGYAAAPPVYG